MNDDNDLYAPLKVGDQIRGRFSGVSGRVVKVHPDGRIDAVKDDGYKWGDAIARSAFEFVGRPEQPVTGFKVGDKVRPVRGGLYDDNGANERVIVYIGERVVYTHNGQEAVCYRAKFEANFEKVPEFFEAGKTYKNAYGDYFEVKCVESNADGTPVAFGCSGGSDGYWTLRRYREGWEEA